MEARWSEDKLGGILRSSWKFGYAIDVVDIAGHERFQPTKGEAGAYAQVLDARVLLRGKTNIKRDERIMLYPYTEAAKVIVLTTSGRNWIPYTDEADAEIVRYVHSMERTRR